MADLRETLNARTTADEALLNLRAFGGNLEDDGTVPPGSKRIALAVIIAAEAICTELRAATTHADFVAYDLNARAARR